jgi:Mn2+/Fe2+ NRAMP family transporter
LKAPVTIGERLRAIGPGLVLAATGVGAGDMVAASVAGARYGHAVIWAAVVGALLKYALTEGIARWQLATGTTLLEGWVAHLGRWVQFVFLIYLVVWSFVVGAALISACGMAAHALLPALSVKSWGLLHSLGGAGAVMLGGYASFERWIKWLIGLMFLTLVGCAWWVASPLQTAQAAITQAAIPAGGTLSVLAVIGGVGGSVTLLSYGYWMRERGWNGRGWLKHARIDLGLAYLLTAMFGVAVLVLSTHALHAQQIEVAGNSGVLRMAAMLEPLLGVAGRWTFLVGFWGAVATSLLGVWQGVPYLFCDFVSLMRGVEGEERERLLKPSSPWYRLFLGWLSLPTIGLLFFDRPVALIIIYSALGALFMPFVALTLLYMNGRTSWVGAEWRNRGLSVVALVACALLFVYLGICQLLKIGS